MANKFPLVFDTTDGNKIKELPSGDNLNLQGSSIVDVININASGTVQANALSVQSISVGGTSLASVALSGNYNALINRPNIFSGDYNDLNNRPVIFSGSYTDLTNKPVIPTAISQLTNDAGYVTNVTAIVPVANVTGLAAVAVTNNYNDLNNRPDVITRSEFTNGALTIDVTNTGNLTGSVFSDSNVLLVDHVNSLIPASVLSGTASIDINSVGNSQFNQMSAVRLSVALSTFEDVKLEGNLTADDSSLIIDGTTKRLFGSFNGTLDGNVNRSGTAFSVTAVGGITLSPAGTLNVPNATDITLSASNEVQISGSSEIGVQSSSGSVQITSFTETDILSNSSFVRLRADTDLTLQGNKIIFKPLQTAPATRVGAAGDKAGEIRIDSNTGTTYIFYCVQDYTDGSVDIWSRTTMANDWTPPTP
jgi:hypothetical protein